jgi:hypothetical protein
MEKSKEPQSSIDRFLAFVQDWRPIAIGGGVLVLLELVTRAKDTAVTSWPWGPAVVAIVVCAFMAWERAKLLVRIRDLESTTKEPTLGPGDAMWAIDRMMIAYEQIVCKIGMLRLNPPKPLETHGLDFAGSLLASALVGDPIERLNDDVTRWMEASKNIVIQHFAPHTADVLPPQMFIRSKNLDEVHNAVLERYLALCSLRESAEKRWHNQA